MSDIAVEVLENSIRVSLPGTSCAVTYQRHPQWRMLESSDLLNTRNIRFAKASFAAAAWKAAYSEAKVLGWL